MKLITSVEKIAKVEGSIQAAAAKLEERASKLRAQFEVAKSELSKGEVAAITELEEINDARSSLQDALTDLRLMKQERRSFVEAGQRAAEKIKERLDGMAPASAYAWAQSQYSHAELEFYDNIVAARIKAMLSDYFGARGLPTEGWK